MYAVTVLLKHLQYNPSSLTYSYFDKQFPAFVAFYVNIMKFVAMWLCNVISSDY